MVWQFSRSKSVMELHSRKMVQKFKEAGHLVFKGTNAFNRGALKQKKGKTTNHFNGDSRNSERLFQTLCSVNQLIVYRAVTDWTFQLGLTDEEKEGVNIPLKKWVASMITRRSGNVGISYSETDTWKQDAGKHELQRVGKENTDDTINCLKKRYSNIL